MNNREGVAAALQKLESSSSPTSSIMKVIVRVETPLAGILKTLGNDFEKIHEALFGMLCQVLNGKSLDLMLAVASVEGHLKNFVTKLIKFNEGSKMNEPIPGKNAAIPAMLFDVSFLILCFIVQTYGSDVSNHFSFAFFFWGLSRVFFQGLLFHSTFFPKFYERQLTQNAIKKNINIGCFFFSYFLIRYPVKYTQRSADL